LKCRILCAPVSGSMKWANVPVTVYKAQAERGMGTTLKEVCRVVVSNLFKRCDTSTSCADVESLKRRQKNVLDSGRYVMRPAAEETRMSVGVRRCDVGAVAAHAAAERKPLIAAIPRPRLCLSSPAR